jgi:hypothetical protein
MVIIVNSQKFACESCIKGHRSSACHHTDRPLYEVKKKGRPVSQCEKCRALRKSKKVHSKCCCTLDASSAGSSSQAPPAPAPGSKPRRFVPTTPALPNGIKDVLSVTHTAPLAPADTRQMVSTLLNPCDCKSVWKCQCRTKSSMTEALSSSENDAGSPSGLLALADAALGCCGSKSIQPTISSPPRTGPKRPNSRSSLKSCRKRLRSCDQTEQEPTRNSQTGPELPPIVSCNDMPSFPIMPPLSTISLLAGTGCTCGFQCACPGCVEHRGPEHASKAHRDCAGGNCSHCVDRQSNIAFALPGFGGSSTSAGPSSSIDRFFARAAALPAPPTHLKSGVLNPTDTSERHELVSVPKLECCGGKCGCPEGRCGCGKVCDGCCEEYGGGQVQLHDLEVRSKDQSSSAVVVPSTILATPTKKSCCAGKRQMVS